MGKDAFNMLLKAGTYGKIALFQNKQWGATLGNALLWGIAIVAAAYLEVNTILWAVILPFNAFISVCTCPLKSPKELGSKLSFEWKERLKGTQPKN